MPLVGWIRWLPPPANFGRASGAPALAATLFTKPLLQPLGVGRGTMNVGRYARAPALHQQSLPRQARAVSRAGQRNGAPRALGSMGDSHARSTSPAAMEARLVAAANGGR